MALIRFGAFLSPHPPDEQFALARRCEELGYDSLWTGDHVSFHNPLYESLTLLASYASITSRIKLGSGVYLLALRRPPWWPRSPPPSTRSAEVGSSSGSGWAARTRTSSRPAGCPTRSVAPA